MAAASGAEPAELAQSRRILFVVILGMLSAIGPFSLDMYLPALPKMAGELHTGTSAVQLSLTFCMLGLALGQLLAGPLSDTMGRRKPLIAAMALYAVSSLLCAFSPTITVLVILRFIQGLSGAAGIVISRAVVRDLFSGKELTRFFSQLMLINGAAPIVAPVLGGQFLRFMSWKGVFVFLFILGLVLLLAVLLGLPETLPKQRRHSGGLSSTLRTFGQFGKDRLFVGYVLSMGLVSAGMFSYISGSSFVLQNLYSVSAQSYSLIFALNGLGIIVASQVTGRLALTQDVRKLFVIGLGIALAGSVGLLLTILLDGGLLAVICCLFLIVSSVGVVSTTSTSLALQNAGAAAGSASALLGLLQFVFGAAASPLTGLGGSATAVPMALTIFTAEVLAVLSCIVLIRGRKAKNR
ncbi:MFS transporter [Paenibacillus yonginensis]|uniref:Bcr/CflA family efflux transporter n=2 Tax=Paenibacillus yonginensis TaxID=1462996 RepID=A0A1B1N6Q7_9BACL|nr:MFS transporter [Paenibacillus yonginensis]